MAKYESYEVVPPFKPKTKDMSQLFNTKSDGDTLKDTVLPQENLKKIKVN